MTQYLVGFGEAEGRGEETVKKQGEKKIHRCHRAEVKRIQWKSVKDSLCKGIGGNSLSTGRIFK
jgi:hypothetical protein